MGCEFGLQVDKSAASHARVGDKAWLDPTPYLHALINEGMRMRPRTSGWLGPLTLHSDTFSHPEDLRMRAVLVG